MTTQHTPTPWELHVDGLDSDGKRISSVRICKPLDSLARGCKPIAEAEIIGYTRAEAEANAQFIIRAVNAYEHDQVTIKKLVEALKLAMKVVNFGGVHSLQANADLEQLEEAARTLSAEVVKEAGEV